MHNSNNIMAGYSSGTDTEEEGWYEERPRVWSPSLSARTRKEINASGYCGMCGRSGGKKLYSEPDCNIHLRRR